MSKTKAADDRFTANSLDELSRVFGISRQALGSYCSKGMPRKAGPKHRTFRYDLAEVFAWLRVNILEAPKDLDPLLTGDTSPGLERYRLARAESAELDLSTKKNQLIPRAEIHLGLSRIATVLRGAGERLARDHGAEAAAVLDDAITDASREITAMCRDAEGNPMPPPSTPEGNSE